MAPSHANGHGPSGWVRIGAQAREQVQWTCESDERRELGRAAGPPGAHTLSLWAAAGLEILQLARNLERGSPARSAIEGGRCHSEMSAEPTRAATDGG